MQNQQTETPKTEIRTWDDFVELLTNQTSFISFTAGHKIAENSTIKIDYTKAQQNGTIIVTEGKKQTIYQYPLASKPSIQMQFISCNRRLRLNELLKFIEQFSAIDMVDTNVYKFVCPDGVGQLSFEKGQFNPSLGQKTMKINISSMNGIDLLQKYPNLRNTKDIVVAVNEFDIFQNRLLARFNYLVQKTKFGNGNNGIGR